MLEPRDRSLLFDSLRPPLGYQLESAVGTTFSLDLMTLLTIPLAFTLFDWTDEQGRPQTDPLALLESLRRIASRMTVFCQTGRIAVPPRQLLLSNLEDSVVQVRAPRKGGVFHPKIWVLRFVSAEMTSEDPVVYRMICASRNITFDRSWDTVVILDGEVSNHPRSLKVNRPLANFIERLPGLAVPVTGERALTRARDVTSAMAQEIQRVQFEPPEDFTDFRFWPLGIGEDSSWPFGDWLDRLAIVSPFLSDRTLKTLADQADEAVLISRVDSLQALRPKTLGKENFAEVFYMDTAADAEDAHEAGQDKQVDSEVVTASPEHGTLTGLHAKIYLADNGRMGHLWTGSANATDAAFHKNVEFLVELQGKKHKCGVDVFLGSDEDATKFRRLLIPFSPRDKSPVDKLQQRLEKAVDGVRMQIAICSLVAEVVTAETADQFELVLSVADGRAVTLPDGVHLRCWPTTLQESKDGVEVQQTFDRVCFRSISFQALTSFFAFRVTAEEEDRALEQTFVLSVPLVGAAANRHDRLLLAILQDRKQVLRYLLLLLADEGTDIRNVLDSLTKHEGDGPDPQSSAQHFAPLLEPLVRALAKDPSKLDRVYRLVEDLRTTEKGRDMLPDRFDEIWQPIWEVRRTLDNDGES